MAIVRRLHLAAVACGLLLVAACGDGIDEGVNEGRGNRGTIDGVVLDTADPVTDPNVTDPDVTDPNVTEPNVTDPNVTEPNVTDPFGWSEIGSGLEEGFLQVPLDHSDPSGDTISLYAVRHRAVDPAHRIGTLLVNPGGPGYGGSGLAYGAEDIYGQDLLDRFDIIGWDPRGTGYSEPAIDCIDDYDHFFSVDSSPDTADERQQLVDLGTEFGQACIDKNSTLLPYVSTEQSARDMDSIRQALGEDTISYFGFSYGSELGATWATLFPDTVRAAVLDGAVDPTVGYLQQNIQQATGVDSTFAEFLAACSDAPSCAFHNGGDAEGAFGALDAEIEARALPVAAAGRPSVTQGVLVTAVAQAMYDQSYWPKLEQALADLQAGDGRGILALYDEYFGYFDGSWDDGLEAYFAIGCLDDPGSAGPDDLFTHESQFAAAAPRVGRSWLAELTFCSVWPVPPVTPVAITGAGAGPILVVGTTGDAITPLASTRKMATTLEEGRLVVVEATQHTGYGVNRCVDDTVDHYLVDPTDPLPPETYCR
jgi:pimeloyl-ACP methyl ester carboxylesterase